jgi:hypothetical protein
MAARCIQAGGGFLIRLANFAHLENGPVRPLGAPTKTKILTRKSPQGSTRETTGPCGPRTQGLAQCRRPAPPSPNVGALALPTYTAPCTQEQGQEYRGPQGQGLMKSVHGVSLSLRRRCRRAPQKHAPGVATSKAAPTPFCFGGQKKVHKTQEPNNK